MGGRRGQQPTLGAHPHIDSTAMLSDTYAHTVSRGSPYMQLHYCPLHRKVTSSLTPSHLLSLLTSPTVCRTLLLLFDREHGQRHCVQHSLAHQSHSLARASCSVIAGHIHHQKYRLCHQVQPTRTEATLQVAGAHFVNFSLFTAF